MSLSPIPLYCNGFTYVTSLFFAALSYCTNPGADAGFFKGGAQGSARSVCAQNSCDITRDAVTKIAAMASHC